MSLARRVAQPGVIDQVHSYRVKRGCFEEVWRNAGRSVVSDRRGTVTTTSLTWVTDRDGVAFYHPSTRIDVTAPRETIQLQGGMICMKVKRISGATQGATGRIIRDSAAETVFAVYRNSSDTQLVFYIGGNAYTFTGVTNIWDDKVHNLVLGWDNGANRYIGIDGTIYSNATAFTPGTMNATWYLNGNAASTSRAELQHYFIGFHGRWDATLARQWMQSPESCLITSTAPMVSHAVAAAGSVWQFSGHNVGKNLYNGIIS